MYFDDHAPPHFHAEYQGKKAMFCIETGKKIKGEFPEKQALFVRAWTLLRKQELIDAWEAVTSEKEPKKIKPLK